MGKIFCLAYLSVLLLLPDCRLYGGLRKFGNANIASPGMGGLNDICRAFRPLCLLRSPSRRQSQFILNARSGGLLFCVCFSGVQICSTRSFETKGLVPVVICAYVIWQWLILGIVPVYGEGGLVQALQQGDNAVQPLKNFIHNPNVYIVGQFFAFFALTTSFFGVTLGLFDFLADGLKVKKEGQGKLLLTAAVFAPPLVIAVSNPTIFLKALDIAGGLGSALLLGLLPVLMVWAGRYRLKLPSNVWLPGGRVLMALMILFVAFEVGFELIKIFS